MKIKIQGPEGLKKTTEILNAVSLINMTVWEYNTVVRATARKCCIQTEYKKIQKNKEIFTAFYNSD